jgi:hypothetical protein
MANQSRDERSDIRSEARGAHWVAWLPGPDGRPADGVVLIGASKEEVEARARHWAARRPAPASLPTIR